MEKSQCLRLKVPNMKNPRNNGSLYLLGAGGFAREIYSYLSQMEFIYKGLKLVGFLDDNKRALDGFKVEHKIVGDIKSFDLDENDSLILAVASPQFKEILSDFYYENAGCIINFIHPTAIIGNNVSIGDGSVFAPYSIATSDVKIGKACTINAFSSLGHDSIIGDFCTLSGHCDITGNVKLGNKVFMGTHASIIPSTIVESNVVIGAGSLVIRKVKKNSTVFGNPAKKIN